MGVVGVLLGAPWRGCSSLFGPCLRAEHEEEEVEEREERKRKGQKKKNGKFAKPGSFMGEK
jgi:hypothetical protein